MNEVGQVVHIPPAENEEHPGWSVVETRIGEAIGFVPTLRCFPRSWRSDPPAWSGTGAMRAVRVESAVFSARYDARVDATQERNWLLQLLSPDFIDWLVEDAQEEFGFELFEGELRCISPGLLSDTEAEHLRCETARVAERIRSEALESEGLGVRELGLGIAEEVERRVAEVSYAALPADSKLASKPFRANAARSPRPYLVAFGGVSTAYILLVVLLAQFDDFAFEIAGAVASWLGPKNTGLGLLMIGVAGWLLAIPEAINIHSRTWGRPAFAREYAAARNLTLESPQSFHRRLMKVDLPAPAEYVLRGDLAGSRDGRLVLCRSGRGLLTSHWNAVVVAVDRADGAAARGGLDLAIDAGYLVASRTASADRSVQELDGLLGDALEQLEAGELELGSPQPLAEAHSSASSTSPSGS